MPVIIGTDGGSDKSVKLISDSATALVAGGRAILDAARSSSAVGDEAEADAMSVFVDLASDVLSNVEIKKESKSVRLSTELKSDDGKLLSPFIPAFQAIGQARYKAEVLNRSRNIALALLNYESAYGKFPAAVMTSKHGKKYSWRVAVLPYIGRQDLFEKYRFDQAWDSEENMKLAKDIPIEFQHPMARGQEKQFTPFFVITGAGTAFDGQQSIEIDKIIDGTSNTISVVEAKKEVFWSQPVDIKYENGKLNTKLGRFSSGTFVTSFFDGSTRLVSDKIDSKILSYMILPSDGNVSNVDVQTGR